MQTTSYKHWIFLFAAIILEVIGTSIMKLLQTEGWILTQNTGYAIMLFCIALSYYLLAIAATRLPIGVAYAFWEGLGLTLITIVSVVIIGEKMTVTRFIALFTILIGALLVHHGTNSVTLNTRKKNV